MRFFNKHQMFDRVEYFCPDCGERFIRSMPFDTMRGIPCLNPLCHGIAWVSREVQLGEKA